MAKQRKRRKPIGPVSGKKNLLEKYNDRPTKGKVGNSSLKMLVDGVTGAVIGTGIGAIAGKWSILAGPVLIFAGHITDEKSGLLRVAGSASMAYGIAKALENQSVNGFGLAASPSDVKTRLTNLKEELKVAFFLDKIFNSDSSTGTSDTADDNTVGAIDLSALDMFEDFNQQEADEFEQSQSYTQLPDMTVSSSGSDTPLTGNEMAFSVYDDPDLTDL